MKEYPKIPHANYDVVSDSLFRTSDLAILEKADGGNFRFAVYDERYSQDFRLENLDESFQHGDVIFGSKSVVRGCISDDIDTFDGSFHRAIRYLRENLDVDEVLEYHDLYGGHLVFFCENMIKHSLDYGYIDDPPPALLGFDIYVPRNDENREEVYPNPYDEDFTGFTPIGETMKIFENVGVHTSTILVEKGNVETPFDYDNYEIPRSSYGPVKAEGVVIRSDEFSQRVKIVSEEFQEKAKKAFGMRKEEADNGTEWIVANYATNPRIRKHILDLIEESDESSVDEEFFDTLSTLVTYDIWEEGYSDVSELNMPINPVKVRGLVYERCREVYDQMQSVANLSGTSLDNVWTQVQMQDVNSIEYEDSNTFSDMRKAIIESKVRNSIVTDEKALVLVIIGQNDLELMTQTHIWTSERDIGRWVIEDVVDDATALFWIQNREIITSFDIEFNPAQIKREIRDVVIDIVNNYEQIDISRDEWEPNLVEETDGISLDTIF